MNTDSLIVSRYRYPAILLRQLIVTDFKLRYQGSTLGYVWSLLRPLMLFAILYVVFANFLRFGDSIPHYPVYLLSGIVLWNFFLEVTNNSVTAIVDKGDLIRKINFPKYVIILATTFSAFINLLLNGLVIAVFCWLSGIDLGIRVLLLPVVIAELFVFALGAGFLLSALFVKLRDVNYIWEVFMQALFYATPIIYPLSMVAERWAELPKFLLLNPVAQVIQDFRYLLITPETETLATMDGWLWYTVPVGIVLITAITAAWYFRRRSPYFAEEV